MHYRQVNCLRQKKQRKQIGSVLVYLNPRNANSDERISFFEQHEDSYLVKFALDDVQIVDEEKKHKDTRERQLLRFHKFWQECCKDIIVKRAGFGTERILTISERISGISGFKPDPLTLAQRFNDVYNFDDFLLLIAKYFSQFRDGKMTWEEELSFIKARGGAAGDVVTNLYTDTRLIQERQELANIISADFKKACKRIDECELNSLILVMFFSLPNQSSYLH